MMRRAITLSLGAAVGLLALVGVAASATHYLQEPYNPRFLRYPSVVALHVVLGGAYLSLAPFQFVRRIRSKHLVYHRRAGRALVAIGLLVGVTALFMGLVIPAAGWSERVVIGLFGSVFLVALAKGFLHVRSGRVALHREWMIRTFAVALATTRLIGIAALLIVGSPTGGQAATIVIVSFAVAFVVHASVAEAWVRAIRKSGVSETGAVKAV